jgi:hypothetical protein
MRPADFICYNCEEEFKDLPKDFEEYYTGLYLRYKLLEICKKELTNEEYKMIKKLSCDDLDNTLCVNCVYILYHLYNINLYFL